MQTGNLCVLNEFGRAEDSPGMYQGDWTELYRSKDLKNWEFVHRFYAHEEQGDDLPDRTEDDMCPSFLPLYDAPADGNRTDKWLQLCIAHNKGCRYYVGTLEKETFHPEIHGRMSWKDKAYFAPEALIDGRNRHILWTWLLDDPEKQDETYGWCGVYGFPRVLWWDGERGCLRMAPAEELEQLQREHQHFDTLQDGIVPVKNGTSFRMKAKWNADAKGALGFRVKMCADGSEYTEIFADRENGKLVMDLTRSGNNGQWDIREEAPLKLREGEDIELDIFVDGCVVEVYCNELQAICRRAFPTDPASGGVCLLPGTEAFGSLDVWEMAGTEIRG
jgi:beta-fructofuranosidase